MRVRRTAAASGVLVALLLALTGCFKVNMDINVHNEKSVDYEVVYALQKEVLKDKSFDEFMKSNDGSADMTIPEGAKVEDFEDAKYKGKRISATNIDPARIAEAEKESDNKMTLVKEGDFYILTMGNLSKDSDDPQAAQIAKAIFDEAILKVTFPGKVVEANGAKIDGNTATVDFLATDSQEIRIKAESGAGFPFPAWALWGGIALLVVIAGLVLLFVLLARRKAPAAAPATVQVAAPPAAGPPSAVPPPTVPPTAAAPPLPGHPPGQPYQPPADPGRDGLG